MPIEELPPSLWPPVPQSAMWISIRVPAIAAPGFLVAAIATSEDARKYIDEVLENSALHSKTVDMCLPGVAVGVRSLFDIARSTAANDPQASTSFSAPVKRESLFARDWRDGLVWFIWFVGLFRSSNQTNQTNETNETNQINKPSRACRACLASLPHD